MGDNTKILWTHIFSPGSGATWKLIDFHRYYNRHVWHSGIALAEYSNRKNQRPEFAGIHLMEQEEAIA
jgi:hypothetical protein